LLTKLQTPNHDSNSHNKDLVLQLQKVITLFLIVSLIFQKNDVVVWGWNVEKDNFEATEIAFEYMSEGTVIICTEFLNM